MSRNKKRAQPAFWKRLAKIFLAITFMSVVGLSLYFLLQNKTWGQRGLSQNMLEGIFLAADVQPDTDIVRRSREDGERWLVHLESLDKQRDILEAINKVLAGQGSAYKVIDQSSQGQQNYLLVAVPMVDGGDLRLIFQVADRKPASGTSSNTRKDGGNETESDLRKLGEDRPRISIILDDIGHKRIDHLRPILNLRYPVTFAVLPFLKYSKANAIFLHQNQFEVILHMPMEPGDYPRNNPGKGAILSHLNDGEIRLAIDRALKSIPFVDGVNNHMGSKITANRTLMRSVLAELKKRDLFFVDSRTHKNSIAFDLSQTMGLVSAKRDVFLDSIEDFDFTVRQLKLVRKLARDQGLAIAIGHPYPSTLNALIAEMPKMEAEGFQFVFVSKMVRDYSESL